MRYLCAALIMAMFMDTDLYYVALLLLLVFMCFHQANGKPSGPELFGMFTSSIRSLFSSRP